MFSSIITGAAIYDGTGGPSVEADVAVRSGRIAGIGTYGSREGERVIDGRGKVLAPGFIDTHSHSDLGMFLSPFEPNKLGQGVSTEFAGNCGFSLFPVTEEGRPAVDRMLELYGRKMRLPWNSTEEYFSAVRSSGTGFNYLPLVGHGMLRLNTMGFSAEPAGAGALDAMTALLAEAMESGAWGFSTGLAYMPGCFAGKEELLRLAKTAARYGGVFTSHIRNQGADLLASIDEVISIARESGVRLIISHLKAYGLRQWGMAERALEKIDAARSEGVEVLADFYPYDSSESTLLYEFPEDSKAGGVSELVRRLDEPAERAAIRKEIENRGELSWDRIILSELYSEEFRPYQGMTVAAIAEATGRSCFDTAADLVCREGARAKTICRLMSEEDLDAIARSTFTVVGSDGYALEEGVPFSGHPRNWGAFPHFYRRWVIEKKAITPEAAIRKMSGMTADFLGLKERGMIREGAAADLVLFDPERIGSPADYSRPDVPAEGIDMVMVNGTVRLEGGIHIKKKAGSVILRSEVG